MKLYGEHRPIFAVAFRHKITQDFAAGQVRVLCVEAESEDDAKRKIETLPGPPGTPYTAVGEIDVFAVTELHINDFLYWKG